MNRSSNEYEEIINKLKTEIFNLKKELSNQKRKTNKVHAEKNYYKKMYYEFYEQFDKVVKERIDKIVKKALDECNHEHQLELMKKNQEIFSLKNKLNVNSSNSSLPSSKNPIYVTNKKLNNQKIYNSRKKTDKHVGGQPNHEQHRLEKCRETEIDEVIEHTMDKCTYCNSNNLRQVDCRQRDVIDIQLKIVKIRHEFYTYKCRDCGKIIKTKVPIDLHAEAQYGPNIQTITYVLNSIGYVSVNRIKKIISGITNNQINLSEGYISKISKKLGNRVNDFRIKTRERILKSPLLHWDDTVVKIGKNKHGCWRGYVNDKYTYFTAHDSKNAAGMDEDAILQNLPSTCYVMHDHLLHNYCKEYQYKNLECNAHITRKLKKIAESAGQEWARNMGELLDITYQKRKQNLQNKITKFTDEEIELFDKRYNRIIEEGFAEYEELKRSIPYKEEENLLKFMKKYKGPITEWVRDYRLPYTNNPAEGSFRFLKSKLKISYQFKNLEHTENFAKITSYVETCGKFGATKYDAIKRLVLNNPYTYEELEKILPTS